MRTQNTEAHRLSSTESSQITPIRLTPFQVSVYEIIVRFSKSFGYCFQKNPRFIEKLKVSERKFQYVLARLIEVGLVIRETIDGVRILWSKENYARRDEILAKYPPWLVGIREQKSDGSFDWVLSDRHGYVMPQSGTTSISNNISTPITIDTEKYQAASQTFAPHFAPHFAPPLSRDNVPGEIFPERKKERNICKDSSISMASQMPKQASPPARDIPPISHKNNLKQQKPKLSKEERSDLFSISKEQKAYLLDRFTSKIVLPRITRAENRMLKLIEEGKLNSPFLRKGLYQNVLDFCEEDSKKKIVSKLEKKQMSVETNSDKIVRIVEKNPWLKPKISITSSYIEISDIYRGLPANYCIATDEPEFFDQVSKILERISLHHGKTINWVT